MNWPFRRPCRRDARETLSNAGLRRAGAEPARRFDARFSGTYTKPRLDAAKLARLGKIAGRLDVGTPSQAPRVAPYWSTEVVGMSAAPTMLGLLKPPRSMPSVGYWP